MFFTLSINIYEKNSKFLQYRHFVWGLREAFNVCKITTLALKWMFTTKGTFFRVNRQWVFWYPTRLSEIAVHLCVEKGLQKHPILRNLGDRLDTWRFIPTWNVVHQSKSHNGSMSSITILQVFQQVDVDFSRNAPWYSK